MSMIKKAILAVFLATALAGTALFALGYGWVPMPGHEYVKADLGAVPDGFVAWYASGWTDHQTYYIFKADRAWVNRAARFARLVDLGQTERSVCLGAYSSPWWFGIAPRTLGTCWKRLDGYGSHMMLHYVPSTGYVFVFDFST